MAHASNLPRLGHFASRIASAAMLGIFLSGCMSSGASTYTSLSKTEKRNSGNTTQELALNVAGDPSASGVMALPDTTTSGNAELTGTSSPYSLTSQSGTSDLQALASTEEKPQGFGTPQFASLSPQAPNASAAGLVPDEADAPQMTPEDMAADARIPALYSRVTHGQCKGGWGPKPRMINAKRITPGDPYYMEMRLRHTPLLPVGHVYIAYGRLSPEGKPLDEKLIMLAPLGGYGGAAFAAAVPMPGVLTPYGDDCIVRPHAAYRISLSPSRYEQLLLEIEKQKAKKPTYSLFAYNCNHFMSDVAKSVGILPPQNIYEPSLQYFFSMMDRNEGHAVPRNKTQLAELQATQAKTQAELAAQVQSAQSQAALTPTD